MQYSMSEENPDQVVSIIPTNQQENDGKLLFQ